jgi:hypothetical protein
MFEQVRNEMETDAMVKFKNGKSIYGIIIDFIKDESMLENLRFVPNHWIELYRATENPPFVMTLESAQVASVDVSLK